MPVLAASGLLYAAGTALNDVFDVERDRVLHPARPLPSGAISRGSAAAVAAGLMAAGVAAAHLAGWWTGLVSLWVAAAIVLYDALVSHTALGPVSMAACRLMNLLLGASLAGAIAWPGLAAAGAIGLHTAGISLLARREQAAGRRAAVVFSWLPCGLAAVGVVLVSALAGARAVAAVPFALAAVAWTGWQLAAALRARTTPAVVRVVKTAILALPFLDAALVAAFFDWRCALAVAALALPAWAMSRWFRMT